MREQLWILFSNKTQPMLRLTYRDSVLALHPFEQARLQRAPQPIAEVSVPEFIVVFDPPSNHSIVPARKIPQVVRRGSMDAPVFDRVYHPAHRLHRRSRHALAKEFALGVFQGSHLEVISEKGEARRDVVPLECVDVDNLRLLDASILMRSLSCHLHWYPSEIQCICSARTPTAACHAIF